MNGIDGITGLRINAAADSDGSALMVSCLRWLMRNHPLTYNQILYPYADALSLSEDESVRGAHAYIFGTHAIFCGVEECVLNQAAEFVSKQSEGVSAELVKISGDDFADADALRDFLRAERLAELSDGRGVISAGDYGGALVGNMPHWRIREESKYFAARIEKAALIEMRTNKARKDG